MKKSNIIYSISFAALLGLSLTSCDKYLDVMPDNRTEVDSEDKVVSLITSAYPSDSFYGFTELFWVFLVYFNIEHVNAAVYLEKQTFAFHHWFAAHGSNISKTEYCSAVANYSNQIAFICIFVNIVWRFLYLQAWKRHTGRVCQAQVRLGSVRFCRFYLDFSRFAAIVVFKCGFFSYIRHKCNLGIRFLNEEM